MAKKSKTATSSEQLDVFKLVSSVDDEVEIISKSAYSNIREWIPTGNYILNACMSGDLFKGVPTGRVTTFAGPSSTGKSYLAVSVCREAQKMGYTPIYLDSEGAIDTAFVTRLGCDGDNFIIKQVNSIKEVSQFVLNICEKFQKAKSEGKEVKAILVLDSLGNLTSDKERDDLMKGESKQDFTKAKDVKAMFRTCAVPLSKLQIPWIVNNHVYNTMSFIPGQEMSGGCLMSDEKVLVKYDDEEMSVPIKNVLIDDLVLSHDGNYHRVVNVWEFDKECYRFRFDDGSEIGCSENHRFLVEFNSTTTIPEEAWRTAKELNEGDKVYTLVGKGVYKQITVTIKRSLGSRRVHDLSVEGTHNYVSENRIIHHNSGITYNSSVTLFLSAAKLEDKENDANAAKRLGIGAVKKKGVLITATPDKSRFCIPQKVKFQIPYFKEPNPYVGLQDYMTWENSGCVRGNCYDEAGYFKLKPDEQTECIPFEFEGKQLYCMPKDTARGMVVAHLGRQVSMVDFFSSMVFTEEFLRKLNENVIHKEFELPTRDSLSDIREIENDLGITEDDNKEE